MNKCPPFCWIIIISSCTYSAPGQPARITAPIRQVRHFQATMVHPMNSNFPRLHLELRLEYQLPTKITQPTNAARSPASAFPSTVGAWTVGTENEKPFDIRLRFLHRYPQFHLLFDCRFYPRQWEIHCNLLRPHACRFAHSDNVWRLAWKISASSTILSISFSELFSYSAGKTVFTDLSRSRNFRFCSQQNFSRFKFRH